MSVENEELIAAAELGEEARNFLAGDLGKYLLGMAEQEVLAAQEDLEGVNPEDTKAVRDLQMKARFGRKFKEWLLGLVQDGDEALHVWQQKQQKE